MFYVFLTVKSNGYVLKLELTLFYFYMISILYFHFI